MRRPPHARGTRRGLFAGAGIAHLADFRLEPRNRNFNTATRPSGALAGPRGRVAFPGEMRASLGLQTKLQPPARERAFEGQLHWQAFEARRAHPPTG